MKLFNLFILFLLSFTHGNYLFGQDTIKPAPILDTIASATYTFSYPRKPNILDSFRTDSLKKELYTPFLMPIHHTHLGNVKGFEKLPYDEIVKYKKAKTKETWFLIFMVSVLLLIMVLRHFYQKKVFGFVRAIGNTTFYREYLDNLEAHLNTPNFLIVLIKSMVFSCLTILVLQENLTTFGIETMTIGWMFLLLGIVFSYFSLDKVFRYVFSRLTLIDGFNKNVFLIQSAIDIIFILILFPAIVFFYYSSGKSLNTNQLQALLLIALSLYYISRTIIALFLNKESLYIHKFLLFTYLCTFEIFPFLIWVKILRI